MFKHITEEMSPQGHILLVLQRFYFYPCKDESLHHLHFAATCIERELSGDLRCCQPLVGGAKPTRLTGPHQAPWRPAGNRHGPPAEEATEGWSPAAWKGRGLAVVRGRTFATPWWPEWAEQSPPSEAQAPALGRRCSALRRLLRDRRPLVVLGGTADGSRPQCGGAG